MADISKIIIDTGLLKEIKGGMSEGQVAKLGQIVIKNNPLHPARTTQEINGYKILQDSDLAPFILNPLAVASGETIILPFFKGHQLRKGLKDSSIPEDLALEVFLNLLRVKKNWWGKQTKLDPNDNLRSMQRTEWQNTLKELTCTLGILSTQFKIPSERFSKSPFYFAGQEYPPLQEITETVGKFLHNYPPYTVTAHGDATGANLLVDPKTRKWKLIDTEWAGKMDPAEALVRIIKYQSTTTIKSVKALDVGTKNGKIELSVNVSFPTAISNLHKEGILLTDDFSKSLQDQTFNNRFWKYMAGSYLREVALATKRDSPNLALFAMIKAGEAILNI